MPTDFKYGPWEPVRAYDAPWIAADGLLTDERTWGSIWDILRGEPQRLTRRERETAITRLKDRVGRNPFSDALIDLATNPFVWMSFLVSPAGASAVKSGSRIFNTGRHGYNAYLKANGPNLRWFATAWQHFDGTPIGYALEESTSNMEKLIQESSGVIDRPMRKLLRSIGASEDHFLDASARANRKRGVSDKLQQISDALHVSLSGADLDQRVGDVRWMPRFFLTDGKKEIAEVLPYTTEGRKLLKELHEQWVNQGAGKAGGRYEVRLPGEKDKRILVTRSGERGKETMQHVDFGEVTLPRWTAEERAAEKFLKANGAWELREAINRTMKARFYRMFGKAKSLADEDRIVKRILRTGDMPAADVVDLVDENKLLRLWRNLQNTNLTGQLAGEDFNFIHMLMGKDTRRALHKGDMDYKEFVGLAKKAFASRVNLNAYMPRNFVEFAKFDPKLGRVVMASEGSLAPKAQRDVLTSDRMAQLRVANEARYHPDDLQRINDTLGGSEDLKNRIAEATSYINSRTIFKEVTPIYRVNTNENLRRYLRGTARSYAAHVVQPSKNLLFLEKQLKDTARGRGAFENVTATHAPGLHPRYKPHFVSDALVDIPAKDVAAGGWSITDVIDGSVRALPRVEDATGGVIRYEDNAVARFAVDAAIPGAFGQVHYPTQNITRAIRAGQIGAQAFARGPVGKWLKGSGDPRLARFVDWVGDLATADAEYGARWLSRKTAGYLYVSHLGLNSASALLNLTQPWLLASAWAGSRGIFKGYREALSDLLGAVEDRAKLVQKKGRLRLSPQERERFYRERIRFFDEADIGDGLAELDVFLESKRPATVPGRGEYAVFEATMKAFEKAEWLNRLTVAHATHSLYGSPLKFGAANQVLGRGRRDVDDVLHDIHRMVQETQFGSGVLNTPAMFMPQGTLISPLFAHPLMRQFQTFVTRSMMGPLIMPSRVGVGREVGLQRLGFPNAKVTVTNPLLVTMADWSKLAGYSSVMYYLAKDLVGADYSRAGFFNTTFEATGLTEGRFSEAEYPFPPVVNPFDRPAITAAWDMIRGVGGAGEDGDLQRAIMRAIPGGVGIHRVINSLPPGYDGIPLFDLQTKYADYANPDAQGNVPVFKADGSLVEYRPVSQIIMSGLGVDLGKHRKAGDFDHWLTTQRDQIVKARQSYLNALNAKEHVQAQQIQREFQRRFGFPLTVSKEQLRAYFRRRNVPRTERILDRLPREIRPEMMQVVAQSRAEGLGIPEEVFLSGTTATQRSNQFARTEQSQLLEDPQALQLLRQAQQQAEAIEDMGYTNYRPY